MCLLNKLVKNEEGLLVRQAYLLLTIEAKALMCNGMGSKKTWWNRILYYIIPNHFFGLDMEEVGNVHDHMYTVGGTYWDKFVADFVFLHNMCWRIYKAGAKHRIKRYAMAMRYFVAVFWGGNSSFNFTGD